MDQMYDGYGGRFGVALWSSTKCYLDHEPTCKFFRNALLSSSRVLQHVLQNCLPFLKYSYPVPLRTFNLHGLPQ
eukprot:73129-Amphidinium_carterae.1